MQENGENRLLPLLCIDDSANDRALVREAISLSGTRFAFHEAEDFATAIPYFQSASESKHPRPALILLDYDLGGHTGIEFLYWLRLMKKIVSIPVIVFSGTAGKQNIAECYSTGANYFLSKPRDLARLKEIVRTLHLSLVSPHRRREAIQLLEEYEPDPRKHPMKATPA